MDLIKLFTEKLTWLPDGLLSGAENRVKNLPIVKQTLNKEYDKLLGDLEEEMKPYRGEFASYKQLPNNGRSRDDILTEIRALKEKEESRWEDGYASGAVYHGDQEHIAFLNEVYALHSQSNPLHSDLWPSATKFEAEIVAMTADMLGNRGTLDPIVGTVSSGGTEGILLAMKVYRDFARDKRGITEPEMIVPVTAHAAFDKAAQYFGIKMIHIPIDAHFQADVDAARAAINRNTIVIVGSAPSFPHGIIDPIKELSELALEHKIGCHVDSCLGGFVLPWAERLGYPVPPFDFRLPGVTSMTADTHKYGYAAKGTSVVLYRGYELRHYQYYTISDWPGGLYFSPTFAGSRPGALSAACWAALVSIGQDGYMDATKRILATAVTIKQAIIDMDDLYLMGDPLWVIAFNSDTLNIYQVMEQMGHRGWSLNGLHRPTCVHIALTLRHTQPGVAERFISDLQESVAYVKENPDETGSTAPIYGLASTIPMRGMVSDMLKRYMDILYKV